MIWVSRRKMLCEMAPQHAGGGGEERGEGGEGGGGEGLRRPFVDQDTNSPAENGELVLLLLSPWVGLHPTLFLCAILGRNFPLSGKLISVDLVAAFVLVPRVRYP